MDMLRATILEGGIDDTLWPEIVLAMTHIKNLRSTRALEGFISPIEMQNQAIPDLHHLRILGSNVYFFLHEEERSLKSAKWEARALRGKLVGFDGHTIYRVYIKDQNKVIRIKDLRIYEAITLKVTESLSDFEGRPTFDGVQVSDEQSPFDESSASEEEKNALKKPSKKPTKVRALREEENNKASKEENAPETSLQRPTKSRLGGTIKPSVKKQKGTTIHILVAQLTSLLDKDWEDYAKVSAFLASSFGQDQDPGNEALESKLDPLYILATAIQKTNAANPADFSSISQLNVEEPETYEWAISGPHAQQWAHAIQEELDQLEKNKTWVLVLEQDIQRGHKPLFGKWVFKVINGAIARFKACWVVRGYLQQFRIDFDQTFLVVIKPMAFRVLFAIAAYYDLDIDQIDVKTASLYGTIDPLVYVQILKASETTANKGMVCKLLKALYGLKQALRLWYERLSKFLLEKLGLKRINADRSIFVTQSKINGPIVRTFGYDIKVIDMKRSGNIERVKRELACKNHYENRWV